MQFLIIAAAGCYHPTCWPGCSQSMLPMPFGGQSLTCAVKTCALTPTCALNAKQILHLRAYRANNQASLHIYSLVANEPPLGTNRFVGIKSITSLEPIHSLLSSQPPPWNKWSTVLNQPPPWNKLHSSRFTVVVLQELVRRRCCTGVSFQVIYCTCI